jgi:hypothetical protein
MPRIPSGTTFSFGLPASDTTTLGTADAFRQHYQLRPFSPHTPPSSTSTMTLGIASTFRHHYQLPPSSPRVSCFSSSATSFCIANAFTHHYQLILLYR